MMPRRCPSCSGQGQGAVSMMEKHFLKAMEDCVEQVKVGPGQIIREAL